MFVYDAACFYVHICVFVHAVWGYTKVYLRLLAHLYLLFPCHASSGACLLYLWGPRYLRAWQRGYFWTVRTFSVGPRSRARSRVNLELGFEIKRTSWWRRRPEQVGTTRANIGFWLWFALRQHLLSWEESKHPWASRNIFKDKTTTQLFSLIILTEHYVTTSQTDVWRADIQKSLSLRLWLDMRFMFSPASVCLLVGFSARLHKNYLKDCHETWTEDRSRTTDNFWWIFRMKGQIMDQNNKTSWLNFNQDVFFKKPAVILLWRGIAFVSTSVPTSAEVQTRVLVPVLCSLGSCF